VFLIKWNEGLSGMRSGRPLISILLRADVRGIVRLSSEVQGLRMAIFALSQFKQE